MGSTIFKVETVEHLNFLAHGVISVSLLNASISLGLFDALGESPKTREELEKSLGLDTTAALALLSPLAALGIIEREGDLWKNSLVADKNLVKGKPAYMGTYITKILYEGQQFPKMGALLDVLKTGKALQRDIYGEDWKSQAKTLIPGQHEASLSTANYLMKKKKLDLAGAKAFLDLGCGSGAYSIAACQAYPQLKACCVDFQEILEVTEKYIAASGLSDRISTLPLSYLDDSLPEGYDVIWFGGTLNGYRADQIRDIFEKVYKVLPVKGQLILYESFFYNDHTGPLFSALLNLSYFVDRPEVHYLTLEEMEQIMAATGFKKIRNEPLVNEMTWLFWAEK